MGFHVRHDRRLDRRSRCAGVEPARVHLLSAYDTSTGVVPAQVQVAAKSNEIPAFALLEQGEARLGGLAGGDRRVSFSICGGHMFGCVAGGQASPSNSGGTALCPRYQVAPGATPS